MFLNYLRKGFSLVELMVTVSLLGGVSLITMKILQDQAATQAYLKFVTDVNTTMATVQTVISNSDRCNEMFNGKATNSASVTPLQIKTGPVNTQTILAVGSYPNFSVTGITLTKSFALSSYQAGVDLAVTFTYKKLSLFTQNADIFTVTKKIGFIATLSSTGPTFVLQSCGPIISNENNNALSNSCQTFVNMGIATWTAGTSSCKLTGANWACPANQVPTGISSLGTFTCTDIRTQIDIDNIFDYTGMNCVNQPLKLINTGTKLKVGC